MKRSSDAILLKEILLRLKRETLISKYDKTRNKKIATVLSLLARCGEIAIAWVNMHMCINKLPEFHP